MTEKAFSVSSPYDGDCRCEPSDQASLSLADFISAASFWVPDYPRYSACIEHAPFAFWLAEIHQPSVFVDFGAGSRCFFFALCQAVQQLGLNCRCFGITFEKSNEDAAGADLIEAINHYNFLYSAFSTLLRKALDAAAPSFADGSIDLLHVDVRYYCDDPVEKFQMWLPKLSSRAIVVFSGPTDNPGSWGDYPLWLLLRQRYPHFDFIREVGLGLVAIGFGVDYRLAALCNAKLDDQLSIAIRKAYARLGCGLKDHFGRLNLRELLAIKDIELDSRAAELTRLSAELRAARTRTIESREEFAEKLARQLKVRDEEEAGLKAKLNVAEERIEQECALRNEQEAALKAKLNTAEQNLVCLTSEVNQAEQELSTTGDRVRALEVKLDAMQRSTSWRATRPLRWIGAKNRSVKRRLRRLLKLFGAP